MPNDIVLGLYIYIYIFSHTHTHTIVLLKSRSLEESWHIAFSFYLSRLYNNHSYIHLPWSLVIAIRVKSTPSLPEKPLSVRLLLSSSGWSQPLPLRGARAFCCSTVLFDPCSFFAGKKSSPLSHALRTRGARNELDSEDPPSRWNVSLALSLPLTLSLHLSLWECEITILPKLNGERNRLLHLAGFLRTVSVPRCGLACEVRAHHVPGRAVRLLPSRLAPAVRAQDSHTALRGSGFSLCRWNKEEEKNTTCLSPHRNRDMAA